MRRPGSYGDGQERNAVRGAPITMPRRILKGTKRLMSFSQANCSAAATPWLRTRRRAFWTSDCSVMLIVNSSERASHEEAIYEPKRAKRPAVLLARRQCRRIGQGRLHLRAGELGREWQGGG